jgi:hypothetical protein
VCPIGAAPLAGCDGGLMLLLAPVLTGAGRACLPAGVVAGEGRTVSMTGGSITQFAAGYLLVQKVSVRLAVPCYPSNCSQCNDDLEETATMKAGDHKQTGDDNPGRPAVCHSSARAGPSPAAAVAAVTASAMAAGAREYPGGAALPEPPASSKTRCRARVSAGDSDWDDSSRHTTCQVRSTSCTWCWCWLGTCRQTHKQQQLLHVRCNCAFTVVPPSRPPSILSPCVCKHAKRNQNQTHLLQAADDFLCSQLVPSQLHVPCQRAMHGAWVGGAQVGAGAA